MSGGSLVFASYAILVLPFTVISQTPNTETCTPSCGNINISYPFRLNGDPQNCGNEKFELSCEANSTTAVLYLSSGKYYVKSINYNNFTIRVVNAGVLKNNNYYPDPIYSLTTDNFTRDASYYGISSQYISMEPVPVIFVTCKSPMNSTLSIETAPCLTYSSKYSYFMVGSITSFDLGRSCQITQILLTSPASNRNMVSCEGICDEIVRGFELSWFTYGCGKCRIDQVCNTRDDIFNEFEPKPILCRSGSGGSGVLLWSGPSFPSHPAAVQNGNTNQIFLLIQLQCKTYVRFDFICQLAYANPIVFLVYLGERWCDPIKNKLSGKWSFYYVFLFVTSDLYSQLTRL